MNFKQWLQNRREGRLSAIPLGMSAAMVSFGDNSLSCDVFFDGYGNGLDRDDGNGIGYGDYYEPLSISLPYDFVDINYIGFGDGFLNGNGSGSGCGDGFLFLCEVFEDLIKFRYNGSGIGHGGFDGYGVGNSSHDLDDLTQRFPKEKP